MPRSVHLVPHADPAELERRYRSAPDGITRSHLQIVWLLACGQSVKAVAAVTGYSRRWISVLIGRYNAVGIAGLGDRRRKNPGAPPLLDPTRLRWLRHWLDGPPPDGGLWTGRKVAQWITGTIGRLVPARTGLAYLHRLGFTRQRPRPHHAETDATAQEVFKAGFRRRLQARRQAAGTALEAWAFDEQRVGLKPVLRRVWAPRGCRPVARGHHRFEWLYVYGFVRPSTGAVVWFLADRVNTALFSAILAAFAREVGAGPDKRVVILLDGAGWHVAADLAVPKGIELEFLPPYSPELQPAEHLWPLTNQAIANGHFDTLDDLEAALAKRCCDLADAPDTLRAETLFHWWPAFA